jgi:hypothetical protein
MMKPTQEQAVAWAKEVSGVEFPAGTAGVKIGMSPEHLERFAALAYEAGRKDENEENAHLYTAPPQRQQRTYTLRKWVGLTDEERTFLAWESNNGPECVAMTEAKLKEKNHAV